LVNLFVAKYSVFAILISEISISECYLVQGYLLEELVHEKLKTMVTSVLVIGGLPERNYSN